MDAAFGNLGFLDAAIIFVILSGIPLIVSLGVGLLLSVFQAATQIQEQTLTFVPKLIALCLVLFFCGPWMLGQTEDYLSRVLEHLPMLSMSM